MKEFPKIITWNKKTEVTLNITYYRENTRGNRNRYNWTRLGLTWTRFVKPYNAIVTKLLQSFYHAVMGKTKGLGRSCPDLSIRAARIRGGLPVGCRSPHTSHGGHAFRLSLHHTSLYTFRACLATLDTHHKGKSFLRGTHGGRGFRAFALDPLGQENSCDTLPPRGVVLRQPTQLHKGADRQLTK